MKTHATLVSILMLVSIAAGAQTDSSLATKPSIDGKTPAECTKDIGDWRNAALAPRMAALRAATTPDSRETASKAYSTAYASIGMRATAAARDCAAKFDLSKLPSAALPDLINLYTLAADSAAKRRATERLLAASDLSPRHRAEALRLGMAQEVSQSG